MQRTFLKATVDPETKRLLLKKAKDRKVKIGTVIEELVRWEQRFETGPEKKEEPKTQPSDPAVVSRIKHRYLDPYVETAPEWVRWAANALRDGSIGAEKEADLKTWMLGRQIETPAWWPPATSLGEALARPDAPLQGHLPTAYGGEIRYPETPPLVPDEPPPLPSGFAPELPPKSPEVLLSPPEPPHDLTAGMSDDLKPEDPDFVYPPAMVPKPITRQYNDPGVPEWVSQVGEALAGVEEIEPAALKALSAWMRGDDVPAPPGWPKQP
jgi:hypothetical protein